MMGKSIFFLLWAEVLFLADILWRRGNIVFTRDSPKSHNVIDALNLLAGLVCGMRRAAVDDEILAGALALHTVMQSLLRLSICAKCSGFPRRAICTTGSIRQSQHTPEPVDGNGWKPLHLPVMVNEVVDCLSPQEGQTILDMTFGAGGHTTSILKQAANIKILALDRDPKAYEIAKQLSLHNGQKIYPLLGRFSECEDLLTSTGIEPGTLDGVLIDAGCSSMQFDTPERGFSLSKDGPLDMRMDGNRYPEMPTAADVVNALDQQALASILQIYGEERHAKKISSAIVQARSIYPITRTQQLASIIAGTGMFARKDLLQRPAHVATKSFQALRIFVNDELNELYAGLKTAQKFLRTGGKLVVISFHSLEDRVVKRFLHGIDMTEKPNLGIRHKIRRGEQKDFTEVEDDDVVNSHSGSEWTVIQKKVLTPQYQDVLDNPRGRSAKLRAAIKL